MESEYLKYVEYSKVNLLASAGFMRARSTGAGSLAGASHAACWARGERERGTEEGSGWEGSRSARSPWLRREALAFARGSSAMLRS